MALFVFRKGALAFAASAFLILAANSLKIKKPHILFIVADDYGWNDVGYHQNNKSSANPDGNPTTATSGVIETPNIDLLASEGRKLENYYVQPLCSPTRSTIMTGRYPSKTGIGPAVIKPTHAYAVPYKEKMLPRFLQNVGYKTHMIGKWHLGMCNVKFTPTHRGFDTFSGYLLGAEDYFLHTRSDSGYNALDFRNSTSLLDDRDKELPPACRTQNGTYSSHVFWNQASLVVNAHKKRYGKEHKPLFMYLAFQNVHGPLQAPEAYIKQYDRIENVNRRTYAAMVTAMDYAVGKVVDAFKNASMWDDTVLVFTTDNGGPTTVGANNYPLRGGKGSVYEGGTRGVSFVRGTKSESYHVPKGSVTNQLMHSTDWLPTLLRIAGTKPYDVKLSGHDQWDIIRSKTPWRVKNMRKSVVHNCNAKGSAYGLSGAIRVGHMKLMLTGDPTMQIPAGRWQTRPPGMTDTTMACTPPDAINGMYLFNITDDPWECHNLASKLPSIVDELTDSLRRYWEEKDTVPDLAHNYSRSDDHANPALRADGAWGPWQCTFE